MATIETRTTKQGEKRYRVKVRLLGQEPRTRTFRRLTDAKAWAAAAETDLSRGENVPTTAQRRTTVGDLIDKFIKEQLPLLDPSSDTRNLESQLAWWKAEAGFLTLDRLKSAKISELRKVLLARDARRPANWPADKLAPKIKPATANRYLAALSKVCKWAWKELGWLSLNPVLSVSKGTEHSGIVRYLTDTERDALLAACKASADPNIHCAVVLALATGARAGNLRMLTWDDVDLQRWTLRFRQTKNRQPRYVPVVGSAQAVVKAHFDRDPTQAGWVFKGARDDAPADLDRPWRAVRAAAGLVGDKHCRFHDLRHTTASYLTMNGATLAEVAEALGHRTLVMAKRYSHQSGEHVRATFERIAHKLEPKEQR